MKVLSPFCLLLLFLAVTFAVDCNEQMVGSMYTPCNSNTRSAIYYWTTTCDPSSYSLPLNIYNLPCNLQCNAGSYLPFGGRTCMGCAAGSYSLGTGEVISNWTTVPEGMQTDCTGINCAVWTFNGTFTESGNNFDAINIDTNLRLYAGFFQASGNMIRFSFSVVAESCAKCDGLEFYIDEELVMPLTPQQLTWKTVQFNVTQGYHEFRWTYHKDFSVSFGSDKATIQYIELIGAANAPSTCTPCVPGTASINVNSSYCAPCTYNTVAPNYGSPTCQNCTSNQTSLPGSTTCTDLLPCTSDLYFASRTACSPTTLTQNIVYQWVTLDNGLYQVCDPTSPLSVTLPATQFNVPCVCPPGQSLNSSAYCVPCPSGEARPASASTCQVCPSGTAAIKALYFSDFSTLPSAFTTTCRGQCDASGWIPRGTHIDTGYGLGRSMDSFLILSNITIVTPGSIEFSYNLSTTCGISCSLDLLLEDSANPDDDVVSLRLGTGVRNFSTPLNPGTYTITWYYSQTNSMKTDSTKVKIFTIVVNGVAQGGAPKCVPCSPGYESISPGSIYCTPCSPGYYSQTGGLCIPASDGYFTNQYNSTSQIQCGPNTQSNQNHTDCVTNCIFTPDVMGIKTISYNLNNLYNPDMMNYAGTDEGGHQYFLNLCSKEHLNTTCFDDHGGAMSTFGCQEVSGRGYAVDIGSVIGFLPSPTDVSQGLIVTLTEGTPGCKSFYGTAAQPRRTNITLICDTNAGIGTPRPEFNTTVEVPVHSCQYHFIWRSLYACPLCTVEDYHTSLSQCVNGKKAQTQTAIADCWDPNPPASVYIDCLSCPAAADGSICGSHGRCDDTDGTCSCDRTWDGADCDVCASGYYGLDCSNECPGGANLPCFGHGVCSSGLQGAGTCTCSTGWTSAACNVCDEGFEGETCSAKAVSVGDVVPWWGFVLIVGGILLIIALAVILWWQKRNVEYKYTSLLRNQPVELEGTDNIVGIPNDDDENENENDNDNDNEEDIEDAKEKD